MTAFGWSLEDLDMQAAGWPTPALRLSLTLPRTRTLTLSLTLTRWRTCALCSLVITPRPHQVADMSNAGKETLFSLGNDAPLAVLSQNPSTTYDYFKQRFAQATNP